jgi:hypothetical protein
MFVIRTMYVAPVLRYLNSVSVARKERYPKKLQEQDLNYGHVVSSPLEKMREVRYIITSINLCMLVKLMIYFKKITFLDTPLLFSSD